MLRYGNTLLFYYFYYFIVFFLSLPFSFSLLNLLSIFLLIFAQYFITSFLITFNSQLVFSIIFSSLLLRYFVFKSVCCMSFDLVQYILC